ncbi:hypothetical protein [Streptomyces sp. NPDC093109]|uniref:hypothetical protein n=1 Tax=Streptomyces sp. NPDC093109 TaxID=3154977 RepID=UPI00344C11C3
MAAWRAEAELTDRYLADVTDLGTRNAGFSGLGPRPGGPVAPRPPGSPTGTDA